MDRQAAPPAFEARSPFERLAALLEGVVPGAEPVDMAVGNPRHPMPPFVADALAGAVAGFKGYPAIDGTPAFREAVHDWLDRRYRLAGWFRAAGGLLPLSGSREGLFLAAVAARDHLGKAGRPAVLFANPFYQAYPAAAHAIGADAVPLAQRAPDSVLPDLAGVPESVLDRAVALYLASPANPSGAVARHEDWELLFALAERHRLMLFADECYSELYRAFAAPPTGALEVAKARGSLDRLVVFNSLSKRSNLAGLRVGFAAGDPVFMALFRRFRNQAGPQVPAPLQAVAAAAFADEAHVADNRRLYDDKFRAAAEALSPLFPDPVPEAGFFLWLDIARLGHPDDAAFAKALWARAGVRAVPGSYLALTDAHHTNPGRGFLRLALVDDTASARLALGRLADILGARA